MVINMSVGNGLKFKMIPTIRNLFFTPGGDIHYIGGSEVLPPPLDPAQEAEVLKRLGTEREEEAKSILIEHNLRLVVYIAKKFENEILMYLRRNNKTKMEVSIDEPLNVDWDGNELLLSDILGTDEDIVYKNLEDEAEIKMLNKAIGKLSKREKLIVELRYGINREDGMEMTQKEVADLLGISQSYISRLEKKIIKRLRKEFA